MTAAKSYDQIPSGEPITDESHLPTPWFQHLWQRLADAVGSGSGIASGSGSFASVSGVVTIPHGQPTAPGLGTCAVQSTDAAAIVVTLVSVDATNIKARLWASSTGGAVPNSNYGVAWHCEAT